MLRIQNRDRLARQVAMVPYVESLAQRLLGEQGAPRVEAFKLDAPPRIPTPGWIILDDTNGVGVGVCPRDVAQGRTSLRRRIEYARSAARLAAIFATGEGALQLRALDQESCPLDWSAYRVSVGSDELWCAVSDPPPAPRPESRLQRSISRQVRLKIRGWCVQRGDGEGNALGEFPWIHVGIEGHCGSYQLKVIEGVIMTLSKVEGEQASTTSESLGVRLDLGEIEITLEELLTLRAGSAIELASDGHLRCFLRIGASTLAAGQIEMSGENLVIRITEMIDE
jgi:hypothetical protein